MSARVRLTISFTALFGAIVVALAVAAYLLVRNDAYLRLDSALEVATSATAMSAEHELNEHATKTGGEADLHAVLNEAGHTALADTQIVVREGSRNAVYRMNQGQGFDWSQFPSDVLHDGATFKGYRIASRNLPVPKFNTTYQIYAATSVAPALAQIETVRNALFVFVPLGLGLAGLAGYFLARRSLRPLAELAETIDAVRSSDLSARVKLRNERDEIGKLGQRFNSLLERLEETFQLQRRFMADASHQIRTPATVALAAAQVAGGDSNATVSECKDALQVVERQMLQLRRIVEEMFFLSQADSSSLKFTPKEMYLDDAVCDALRAAKALARPGQVLKFTDIPEARCLGDEDLLRQAVLILLDNALKFAPPDGHIEVNLFPRGDNWVCAVTDNGIGISREAQSRIFERFFRESRPGNEAVAGSGLGLAIAQSIVENHGGTLRLVESRPGRTIFEMTIPGLAEKDESVSSQANSLAVKM